MLKYIVEAIIFASGSGIPKQKLFDFLINDYDSSEINEALEQIRIEFSRDRGIILIEANNILQFQSNPGYGQILSDILLETREREISKTLLQVLAIIAYKQPVTKGEIEDLRGINSDYVIAMLQKLGLIDAIGRKETVGRPIIYGTTNEFLKKFGIKSLSELPDYDDLMYKIKNTYERFYAKSSDLYREDSIDNKLEDKNFVLPQEAIPDFMQGEDFVEIE
ncbi:MAG: SMC-Scp complex subunit ScpB [Clostridiales bacterium]|jgi:segregation and condensation protein B|nr:SMC-Scp complex subunit ScpB [Clostridiales bacterium]